MENLAKKIENTMNHLESTNEDFKIGLVSVNVLLCGLMIENEELRNQISDLEIIITKFIESEKNK